MDVRIEGTLMSPEFRKVPPFVVQDAASHEDGVRTGALIIAAAAPRGTQINVGGIVMDAGTFEWKSY